MKPGILVVYAIAPDSHRAITWNDGFVHALRLLSDRYDIRMVNALKVSLRAARAMAREADLVLAKSNWGWIVDKFVRRATRFMDVKRAIMVSGIRQPRSARYMTFYDVIYYQTEWYGSHLPKVRPLVHAYGVSKQLMHPPPAPVEKEWDWLYVGKVGRAKRPLKLLDKTGRRLVVAELSRSNADLVAQLKDAEVQVIDYVPHEELRGLYWKAHRVYVPGRVDGGGERVVMEALACGTEVEIESDNPKLAEIAQNGPGWDEHYFAQQLESGFRLALRNEN